MQINQNFGRFRLPERVYGLVAIPGSISGRDVPRNSAWRIKTFHDLEGWAKYLKKNRLISVLDITLNCRKWAGRKTRVHLLLAGEAPAFCFMRELSVFVDESGDFGQYDYHCPFYIVSMVFHEQANDLTEDISDFERKLSEIGYEKTCVHCGPIIRAEETLCVEKKHIEDDIELVLKLSKQLSAIIKNHLDYFQSFDAIKIYYDNGQVQVRRLLTSVFGVLLENVSFKTVSPSDYRLFQVADLVCTLKLVSIKFERKISSKAEKGFFGSPKEFKENYSKSLKPKKMK